MLLRLLMSNSFAEYCPRTHSYCIFKTFLLIGLYNFSYASFFNVQMSLLQNPFLIRLHAFSLIFHCLS